MIKRSSEIFTKLDYITVKKKKHTHTQQLTYDGHNVNLNNYARHCVVHEVSVVVFSVGSSISFNAEKITFEFCVMNYA